jgi:histidine triad (HIT) family protein
VTRQPDCIFCDIVAGELRASIVLEDDLVLAFMNLGQFNDGHVLVIPKAHLRDVREFDPGVGAAVMNAVTQVSRAVTQAFAPDGLTVRHNIGDAGGQDVFHAHIHVQARNDGDGLHRAYPSAPPHPPRAELDRLASTIRDHLPDLPR